MFNAHRVRRRHCVLLRHQRSAVTTSDPCAGVGGGGLAGYEHGGLRRSGACCGGLLSGSGHGGARAAEVAEPTTELLVRCSRRWPRAASAPVARSGSTTWPRSSWSWRPYARGFCMTTTSCTRVATEMALSTADLACGRRRWDDLGAQGFLSNHGRAGTGP
jgi:hypothetical protein